MNTTNLNISTKPLISIHNPVVGRWVVDMTCNSEYGGAVCHEEYEFCADGTATWYYRENDDTETKDDELEIDESFRYSVDETTIILFSERGICDTIEYQLDGTHLTLYFSDTDDTVVFTRVNPVSNNIIN